MTRRTTSIYMVVWFYLWLPKLQVVDWRGRCSTPRGRRNTVLIENATTVRHGWKTEIQFYISDGCSDANPRRNWFGIEENQHTLTMMDNGMCTFDDDQRETRSELLTNIELPHCTIDAKEQACGCLVTLVSDWHFHDSTVNSILTLYTSDIHRCTSGTY